MCFCLYYLFIIIFASVPIWMEDRQIISSNYNPNTFREFFDTYVEQSLILVNKLEKVEQNGNKIIFLQHIERCALNIACSKNI